jgi:CBS domain-containing protein
MRHRIVGELMTRGVVSADPDTPFKEIAQLLAGNDVTSVPVIDDQDRPLGVVSEADLLRHEAAAEDPNGLLPEPRLSAGDRDRSRATTARGLMTSPAVCARPEWTVVEAARVMDQQHFKRLLVVDEAGRLIGIVSRSDLLRVFLRHDRAILEEIRHDVVGRILGLSPDQVSVKVSNGLVTVAGTLDHRSVVHTLVRLAQGVDGVIAVADELGYRVDDTGPAAGARRSAEQLPQG